MARARWFNTTPHWPYVVLLLASCVNIAWMLLYTIAADLHMHLIWIDCFAREFWQGDLYPRWCFDANEGLGVPLFFFYFPLPYYAAALFYPLTYMGVSPYMLFTLLCFIATCLTALSCFSWLKDIVAPQYAVLVTMLFLFMPYRMEVMYFRVGYAELWCMVFLPLVFKYIRRIAMKDATSVMPLALSIGLAFLAHGPSTVIALLFGGVYVLMMTGMTHLPKIYYGISAFWGIALAAFYLVPAWYYQKFLAMSASKEKLVEGFSGWANGYISLDMLSGLLARPIEAFGLTVLCLFGISYLLLIHSPRVGDGFVRREIVAWTVMSILVLCLIFPVSAPFYALMGGVSKFIFPWRMQMIVMMGFTYVIAVWVQWFYAPRDHRRWKMAYGVAALVILTIGFALVDDDQSLSPDAPRMRISKVINTHEYRSQWIDPYHWRKRSIFLRHDRRDSIPKAELVSGQGDISVTNWRSEGIELQTQSDEPISIRLDHNYFPSWQANLDKQRVIPIRPENKTGQMLLDIPAGNHSITITHSVAHGNPNLIISQWVSIAALVVMLSAWFRPKRFDNQGRA